MITWRKSSRSGGGGSDGQECVEVARLSEAIGVRDSKNPAGGNLSLTGPQFADLLAEIKAGKLSL
jgi:uncharacterized protein DUF397